MPVAGHGCAIDPWNAAGCSAAANRPAVVSVRNGGKLPGAIKGAPLWSFAKNPPLGKEALLRRRVPRVPAIALGAIASNALVG